MGQYRAKKLFWRGRFFSAVLLVGAMSLTACSSRQESVKDEYDKKEEQRQKLSRDWFDDSQAELDTQKNMVAPTQELVGKPAIDRSYVPEITPGAQNDLAHITEIPEKKLYVAEFSTYYSTENTSRAANIARAAELLDGLTIEPGEVFSCSTAIGPITEENGYFPAGTYVQGKVEDGIGGGVCQISTTLYNAALYAKLTIVERSPHSMAVTYVDPARDAAIAGNYKDLKLRNDYAYPVEIAARAKDGELTISIHTAEEDIGNEVELISIVLDTIDPGEQVVTVDESLPDDYYKVTQKAHTGYIAELYRVTRRDGVELLREKINTSEYAATPEYVTVGGGGSE
ncbi:MAG: VanW family protein [Lachnospiraceae bacterium]|nr:VanW family protein [Lachnospiraceae bacterium]